MPGAITRATRETGRRECLTVMEDGPETRWITPDPDLNFDNPRLADLLRYWRDKRGERLLPAHGDIDPIELKAHLGLLYFVDVEREPRRYRFRMIGTAIVATLGRDMSGRYFEDIYPDDILADTVEGFDWIVEHRAPLRLFGIAVYAEKRHYDFEILHLPLASDGETVSMVLGELLLTLATAR